MLSIVLRSCSLALLLGLLASSAQAARYFCPYEVSLDADGMTQRQLAVRRLTAVLRTAQGVGDQQTPWSEDEVAGNRAIVTLPARIITAALETSLTAIGCTPVPAGYVRVPARAPRKGATPGTVVTDDPSQPVVNPRLATAYLPQHLLRTVAVWLSVPPALADSINPVIDNFNRANETPIGGNWTHRIDSDQTGNINITTNVIANTVTFSTAFYNLATYALPAEVYFTMVDATGASGNRFDIWVVHADGGTATPDGFRTRVNKQDAATDLWSLERIDNGVFTTIGADAAQEVVDGDKVRLYRTATEVTLEYYNGVSWSQVRSDADSTYSSAVNLGMGLNTGNLTLDDVGGGAVTLSLRRVSPLWFR